MTAFSAPYSLGQFQSRVYTVTLSVKMHAYDTLIHLNIFRLNVFLCIQSNARATKVELFTLVDALIFALRFDRNNGQAMHRGFIKSNIIFKKWTKMMISLRFQIKENFSLIIFLSGCFFASSTT